MKSIIIFLLLLLAACEPNKYTPTKKVIKTYTIICKHPLGHIESFKVNELNFEMPYNFKGGIWTFRTVEGVSIRSSYCHTSSKSIQIEQQIKK